MSESEVRAGARAAGKDEEAALQKWRTLARPSAVLPLPSNIPTIGAPEPPIVAGGYEPPPQGSVAEAQEELNEASGRKVVDKNGGFLSGLKEFISEAGEHFAANPATTWQELAGGLARGGVAGVRGGFNASRDELRQQQHDVTKAQGKLDQRTKNEENRAKIRYTNAQAEKAENYDEIEARKADERAKVARAAELNRTRNALVANLRLFKGQKLDPNVPAHAALLQRAAEVGVVVDPESWNSAKDNLRVLEFIDPDAPTKKRRVSLNLATGEQEDLGQSAYVQPVGADGMTESQRRSDADRDAARADSQARFERMFGLGIARFEESQRRGLSSDAARSFGIETRGQFERARAIEREIADLERRKNENLIRKGEADERINALRGEATQIGGQIEASRSKALGGISSSARPAAPRTYTADEIRARARSAGKDPEAALRAARARRLVRE